MFDNTNQQKIRYMWKKLNKTKILKKKSLVIKNNRNKKIKLIKK